eukprot:1158653-Pelagomonas_calceolata.AAC.7
MDSINHVVLRCPNPTMSGVRTNRHHVGLGFCVKALSKGRYGSFLIAIDACRNERLLDQGIQVPISRAIPLVDRVFPNGTGSSARHQSRLDVVFVRSIPGRQAHLQESS